MKSSLKARQLARMSDNYKTALGRVAYEKSRGDKPEDVMATAFRSGFVVALLGFITKLFRFFGKRRGVEKHRTHARGYTRGQGVGKSRRLPPAAPLKHPREFTKDELVEARRQRRKLRRYCARGYGYQAPPPKAGEVEYVGKRAKSMRRAG